MHLDSIEELARIFNWTNLFVNLIICCITHRDVEPISSQGLEFKCLLLVILLIKEEKASPLIFEVLLGII